MSTEYFCNCAFTILLIAHVSRPGTLMCAQTLQYYNPPPVPARKTQCSGATFRRAVFSAKEVPGAQDLSPRAQTHLPFGCSVVGVMWKPKASLNLQKKIFISRCLYGSWSAVCQNLPLVQWICTGLQVCKHRFNPLYRATAVFLHFWSLGSATHRSFLHFLSLEQMMSRHVVQVHLGGYQQVHLGGYQQGSGQRTCSVGQNGHRNHRHFPHQRQHHLPISVAITAAPSVADHGNQSWMPPRSHKNNISTSLPVDGRTKMLLAKWTTTVDSSSKRFL